MSQPTLMFSRKIQDIQYNDEHEILTIYFNTNLLKRYLNVPERVFQSLQNAADKDQFYQTVIDGAFCVE